MMKRKIWTDIERRIIPIKIVGLTSEDNLGSINLLKKLGMNFEKTVKISDDDPGTVLYS